jgi:hypothetical protein
MLRRTFALALALAGAIGLAGPASALVVARVEPAAGLHTVGDDFSVQILASFTVPQGSTGLLGFGLDLAYDTNVITLSAPPVIGPSFTGFSGPDGDGLGGIAAAALGAGEILLATLSFHAQGPGFSALTLGITPGDLTEGFPLDPTGFDTVELVGAGVTVVPEPASALLLGLALAALGLRRTKA